MIEELRADIGADVSCTCVPDRGKPGRVLEALAELLAQADPGRACFYNIGPQQFLVAAMELEEGLSSDAR